MVRAAEEHTARAKELFAPLGPTYDRYARILSFGQDPRWRSFLVSRVEVRPGDSVLDVACGTGAVSIELVRRHGCRVVGLDQSAEMLAEGRRRVEAAGLAARVRLEEGRAEELPYENGSFDALTFTYLLRYVNDPAAVLAELTRAVKPGGTIAMLEFHLPERRVARAAWNAYVNLGLPVAGRFAGPGWREVGTFLGPSIRGFYERYSLPDQLELWRAAGIQQPRARTMSLGGGVVVWGRRGE